MIGVNIDNAATPVELTLTGGSRYRALDWSIVVVEDGLVMVNDMTGHGVRVTTSDVRAF